MGLAAGLSANLAAGHRLVQAENGTPAVGARRKIRVILPERLGQQEGILTLGELGQSEAAPQQRSTCKAAKIEFPLISSHNLRSPVARKVKRPTGWDESGEWRYLTAIHSHSVKRLREKFDRLEDRETEWIAYSVISAGYPTSPLEPKPNRDGLGRFPATLPSFGVESSTQAKP